MEDKRNLVGLSRAELVTEIRALGEKTFRANQLWHWIYYRGETDFSRMTTLAKDFASDWKTPILLLDRP